MSYLGKRKLVISSVLTKKGELESQLVETKTALENEQARLLAAQELREKAQATITEIDLALSDLDQYMQSLEEGHNSLVSARQELLGRYDSVMDAYIRAFNEMTVALEEKRSQIEALQKKSNGERAWLEKESARLQSKENDLGIYERRLRKGIEAAGLEEKIKLIFNE